MFSKRSRQQFSQNRNFDPRFGPMPSMYPQQGPPMTDQNYSSMYPELQFNQIQMEIKENRRRINNLAKRIIRIENYLRIRDTSDFSIIEEDQVPNDFSMQR